MGALKKQTNRFRNKVMVTLKNCFLFGDLTDGEFETLLRLFKEKSFRYGEVLLNKGEINTHFYVLFEGTATVKETTEQGLDLDIYKLNPGEFFGEMSFFDNQPISAKVVASKLVRTLRISFSDLRDLFQKFPEIETKFLRQVAKGFSKRLRQANSELRNSLFWA
jgi:CRP-like cAMP-binding protein